MLDNYHTFTLSGIILLAYTLSYILLRLKKIQLINHRKFWNIALLISFLVSGLLGLLLALAIDQDWLKKGTWFRRNYREILWLHVEFGITMALISIFHIVWHIKYFLRIFKR